MAGRQPSPQELFQHALKELDQSIYQPNILRYGERDYPEQMRFHRSTAPGRFISGGNRGGKTDAEVVEAIWWATDTHPFQLRPERWGRGPLSLRFVVVDIAKGVEQIIIPKMKRWIPKSYLVDASWDKSWDKNNLILTFANGSTIDFVTWGMDMMKLGGVPRHMIFFDEEPPQHIFNESMARLLDYKGMWVIAATPTKGMGWTYDLLWEPAEAAIAAGEPSKIDIFTLSAEQNPYIQAEADDMDFYFMGMDKEEREIREKGSFVARSGLVFPTFSQRQELYVVELGFYDIPKDWEIYASVDHGINNPTAWLWHAVSPNNDIITFAEHYKSDMIVSEHAQVVKKREADWKLDTENLERMGDPAMKQRNGVTGTSIIQEYALNGLYINVDGIPHSVEVGIEKMQAYFRLRTDSYWSKLYGGERPKWVVSTNCPNFVREMRKLRWATYASDKQAYEQNKQETVHKKDDHAFDSARYFATTRPDLSPVVIPVDPSAPKVPTTLSYEEMMLKMREDPDIRFSDDVDPAWQETSMLGTYYSEEEESAYSGY